MCFVMCVEIDYSQSLFSKFVKCDIEMKSAFCGKCDK